MMKFKDLSERTPNEVFIDKSQISSTYWKHIDEWDLLRFRHEVILQ